MTAFAIIDWKTEAMTEISQLLPRLQERPTTELADVAGQLKGGKQGVVWEILGISHRNRGYEDAKGGAR